MDLLVNCFSPLAIEEFRRVLSPGGAFVYVVPSEKHLWELKQVLYEPALPNQVKQTPLSRVFVPGDPPCGVGDPSALSGRTSTPCSNDADTIGKACPVGEAERLAALTALDVTIASISTFLGLTPQQSRETPDILEAARLFWLM